MNITPLDIRKQTFKRTLRGCDPDEVEAFLEMVAEEYERLNRENIGLRDKSVVLRTEVDRYKDMEQTLQEMLRTAQKAADGVRENARREGDLIVKEADIRGNRAIEKARSHVQSIRSEIVDLKNKRDMFLARFRALVQSQGDFLAQLSLSDPEVVKESDAESEARAALPSGGGAGLRPATGTPQDSGADQAKAPDRRT